MVKFTDRFGTARRKARAQQAPDSFMAPAHVEAWLAFDDDGAAVIDVRAPMPDVIDLRDAVTIAPPVAPQAPAEPAAEAGSVCPHCSGPTRLDHLDTVARMAFLECRDCGLRFQQRFRQTP